MAVELEFSSLDVEASQSGFARLIGASQPAVAKMVDKGLLARGETFRRWLLAYCEQLREQAAGHLSEDGIDLTRERAMTERVERHIKELQLHERLGQLVPAEAVEDEHRAMVTAARAELLIMADKLKSQLDTRYGIDCDPELIRDHARIALKHLAGDQPDAEGTVPPGGGRVGPAA